MAHYGTASLSLLLLLLSPAVLAVTCPGFPGYCSESFPGMSCTVVCARGRNNVPLCQEDGTWTDIPRCIEHDPGVEEQIAGLCPGVPGYCSTAFYDGRCNFNCPNGPDINSVCTHDGTWEPYPTCRGDIRETQDGCNGCPGPNGDKRNRTAEAILEAKASRENNEISHNRVPKAGSVDSRVNINRPINDRKTVPSFAGNVKFGKIDATSQKTSSRPVAAITKIQQQQLPRQQQQQQQFPRQQQQQQQQQFPRQQQQQQRRPTQQQFPRQQPTQQTFSQRRPTQQQFPSRQQQQQPSQQQLPRQQQPSQQRRPTQQQQQQPTSTLFNQIRNRINQRQPATDPPARPTPPTRFQDRPQSRPVPTQSRAVPTQSRPVQTQSRPVQTQSRPVQTQSRPVTTQSRPLPQSRPVQGRGPQPSAQTPLDQTFGPFQSVDLSNALGGAAPARSEPRSQPLVRQRPVQRQDEDGFFGVFEEVNLQG